MNSLPAFVAAYKYRNCFVNVHTIMVYKGRSLSDSNITIDKSLNILDFFRKKKHFIFVCTDGILVIKKTICSR